MGKTKKPSSKASKNSLQGIRGTKKSSSSFAPTSRSSGSSGSLPLKKKSRSSAKEKWPLPRRVLFRPQRSSYVRREIPFAGCVFCRAADLELSFESLCVFKTNHSMIVLNKFPYNSGHLLVLPLRHCGNLLDLSAEESQDLHETLRLALKAQKSCFQAPGANVGLNHGVAAGAGLPDHLHYHLIPRWAGDLNFFPLVAETKVVIETLEQTYERYMEYFKSGKGSL